jgi:hypothetical protein
MAKFIFSGFGYGNDTCLVRGALCRAQQQGCLHVQLSWALLSKQPYRVCLIYHAVVLLSE